MRTIIIALGAAILSAIGTYAYVLADVDAQKLVVERDAEARIAAAHLNDVKLADAREATVKDQYAIREKEIIADMAKLANVAQKNIIDEYADAYCHVDPKKPVEQNIAVLGLLSRLAVKSGVGLLALTNYTAQVCPKATP